MHVAEIAKKKSKGHSDCHVSAAQGDVGNSHNNPERCKNPTHGRTVQVSKSAQVRPSLPQAADHYRPEVASRLPHLLTVTPSP